MTRGLRGAYCIAKPRSSATPAIRNSQLRQRPPPWRVHASRIATDVEPYAAITLDVLRAGGWSSLRMLQDHYGHLEHSRIDHVVTHATNVLDHGPMIDITPNTKEDPS